MNVLLVAMALFTASVAQAHEQPPTPPDLRKVKVRAVILKSVDQAWKGGRRSGGEELCRITGEVGSYAPEPGKGFTIPMPDLVGSCPGEINGEPVDVTVTGKVQQRRFWEGSEGPLALVYVNVKSRRDDGPKFERGVTYAGRGAKEGGSLILFADTKYQPAEEDAPRREAMQAEVEFLDP